MKFAIPFSLVALLCSVAALVFALTSAPQQPSQAELDALVDAALTRKEKMYVQSLAPQMDRIYKDMLGPRYQTPEKPPETLGELFTPAINIVNNLTSGQ